MEGVQTTMGFDWFMLRWKAKYYATLIGSILLDVVIRGTGAIMFAIGLGVLVAIAGMSVLVTFGSLMKLLGI